MEIGEYEVVETLFESKNSIVYKVLHEGTRKILKVLKQGISPSHGRQRLRKEYNITKQLATLEPTLFLQAIDFIQECGLPGIVWEDIGLETLQSFINHTPMSISNFLVIAKQLIRSLHIIHSAGVIHRDITPTNILINRATLHVYISDFGCSSYWREFEENLVQTRMGYPSCGTYQYMSPEHTGKVNRPIDHRSDIYSLGIVFYEMLQGYAPLHGITSRLGILFAHVALQFPPIHSLQLCHDQVPLVISNIISKMLQKEAENRYQSCLGLLYDLEQGTNYFNIFGPEEVTLPSLASQVPSVSDSDVDSLEHQLLQLQMMQRIQQTKPLQGDLNYPLELGTKDRSSTLQSLRNIFGRDRELRAIVKLFSASFHSSTPNAGVVVVGFSGSGKSVLISKALETITSLPYVKSYLLIETKFQQFSAATLQCLMTIFLQMLRAILQRSQDERKLLAEMLNSLGSDIAVLREQIIPELSKYFPDLEEPVKLSAVDSRDRLREAVRNWVSFVSEKLEKGVIIIFIDDLQWGDDNSISMLKDLFNLTTTPIFFIFAARSNEIIQPEAQSLVEDISSNPVRCIHLVPLDSKVVAEIIGEMTSSEAEPIMDLAQLVTKKTQGNPFFVIQFITKLYTEEILRFNFNTQRWDYSLGDVEILSCTNNVIDLLVDEIDKLSPGTRKVLSVASCIGIQFNVELVGNIIGQSTPQVLEKMTEALQSGLIQPIYSSTAGEKKNDAHIFLFLHDRVHEGIYITISEEKRKKYHYHIGNYLKSKLDSYGKRSFHCRIGTFLPDSLDNEGTNEGEFFDIVDHLQKGKEMIKTKEEMLDVVDLFCEAASLSKKLGNFTHSLKHATYGYELLEKWFASEKECWMKEYHRCKELYKLICEMRSVCREDVENDFEIVFRNTKDTKDRLEFYYIQITYLTNTQQLGVIEKVGFSVLREFGYSLQEDITTEEVIKKIASLDNHFNHASMEEVILALPRCDDENLELFLSFVIHFSVSQYLLGKLASYCNAILLTTEMTMKYGLLPTSGLSLSALGFSLTLCFGPSFKAYNYAQIGIQVSELFLPKDFIMAQTYLYSCVVSFACSDINYLNKICTRGIHYANLAFDFGTTGYIIQNNAMYKAFFNTEISSFLVELQENMGVIRRKFKEKRMDVIILLWALYESHYMLLENSLPEPLIESLTMEVIESAPAFYQFAYKFYKMMAHFYLGNPDALVYVDDVAKLVEENPGFPISYETYFYIPLIRFHYAKNAKERTDLLPLFDESISRFENLAQLQEHFAIRLSILQIQRMRIHAKDSMTILRMLEETFQRAKTLKAFHIAGLAAELMREVFRDSELQMGQQECAEKAKEMYRFWGAIGIRKKCTLQDSGKFSQETSTSTEREISIHNIVLAHVTEILTNERSTEDSITVFCKIILQHSGADCGYIFFRDGTQSDVFLLADWNNHGIVNVYSLPTVSHGRDAILSSTVSDKIPFEIVLEVLQSGVTTTRDNNFDGVSGAGSICCVPMKNRTNTVGAVYLENTLTRNAFPLQQLTLLEHLACQIISIVERNELNRNLKKTLKKVQKRARMLEALNRMKDDFVASTSHELRTPLNSILGFTDILRESELTDDQHECCNLVYQSAEGLLGVINDILDFQRCQQDTIKLDVSSFDLRKLFDLVIRLVAVKAGSVDLILDIDDSLPSDIWIRCDRLRLQQILLNLLSNAVKFTSKGSITLGAYIEQDTAILKTFMADKSLLFDTIIRLEVRDTGIGIEEAQYEHMFKPFSQLDSGPKRKYTGTGLGLVISQNFVRVLSSNHSSIEFESELGKGTSFFFRLPIIRTKPEKQRTSEVERREMSLNLLKDRIFISLFASPEVQKFFSSEIRELSLAKELYARDSLKDVLRLVENEPVKEKIVCFIDLPLEINELELVEFFQAMEPFGIHLFWITHYNNRNRVNSFSSQHNVSVITKPFYKDLIVNHVGGVLQASCGSKPQKKPLTEAFTRRKRGSEGTVTREKELRSSGEGKHRLALMVEDNKMNQRVQSRMLKLIGIECEIAENGVEGVKKFEDMMKQGKRYCFILMDFHMPEMDGKEATTAIRELEVANSVPPTHIIGLTADTEGKSVGMCNIITKPIKKNSFTEAISKFLDKDCLCSVNKE